MKIVFLQTFLILFLVVLQASFVDILFPAFVIPVVILSASVIWTLTLGFREALWFIIPLLLVYDSLSAGMIEPFSLFIIFFCYAVSFISRRILLEHSGLSILIYASFIYGALFVYQGVISKVTGSPFFVVSTVSMAMLYFIVTIAVFACMKIFLLRFQAFISQIRSDQALMIR